MQGFPTLIKFINNVKCAFAKSMHRWHFKKDGENGGIGEWVSPQQCGNTIFFRSKRTSHSEETYGDFTFFAGDIEDFLVSRNEKDPGLARGETGEILNWIKHRTLEITEPCYVPESWDSFGHLASEMISEGHGNVFCIKCNIHYSNRALSQSEDHRQPYWFHSYLDCPEGHHLIVEHALHIINTREIDL